MTARKLKSFEEKIAVFMRTFAGEENSQQLFQAKYPYISADEAGELFRLSKAVENEAYLLLQPQFQFSASNEALCNAEVKERLLAMYPFLDEKGMANALWRALRQLRFTAFFAATRETFRFLETSFAFQFREERAWNLADFRDTTAGVRYASARVGIEICWTMADGSLRVALIEFRQDAHPETFVSWFMANQPEIARVIDLYDLAEMLGSADDPDFLLKRSDDLSLWRKQLKIVQVRMPEVLTGLARATQKYAAPILCGDTALIARVIQFRTQQSR